MNIDQPIMQENPGDQMEGVEDTQAETRPLMTAQEIRLLEVYDRLETLQLEIALLKAQGVLSQDEPEEVSEEDIKAGQQDLLKAKAAYQVRNNIIESVLIANPILKAVHGANNATVVEQDILPLAHQRDTLSIMLTELSSKILTVQRELTKAEIDHVAISRTNVELSSTMLALAEEANNRKKEDINDLKVRQQLDEQEALMKISRQRWRIMKGTASATIAASGVDWARDPKLLEIMLDDDGEED